MCCVCFDRNELKCADNLMYTNNQKDIGIRENKYYRSLFRYLCVVSLRESKQIYTKERIRYGCHVRFHAFLNKNKAVCFCYLSPCDCVQKYELIHDFALSLRIALL